MTDLKFKLKRLPEDNIKEAKRLIDSLKIKLDTVRDKAEKIALPNKHN